MLAAEAHIKLGEHSAARAIVEPLEDSNDPYVLLVLGRLDSRLGKKQQALAHYQRAFQVSSQRPDLEAYGWASLAYAHELFAVNAYDRAIEVLDWMLHTSPETLVPTQAASARLLVTRALFRLGDLPAAEHEFAQLQAAKRAGEPTNVNELLIEAQLRLELGQLNTAGELLERAAQAARATGDALREVAVLTNLIRVATEQGDWLRARAYADAARRQPLTDEDVRDIALRDGIAARRSGDLAYARAQLELAGTLVPTSMTRWRVPYELGLLDEATGSSDQAALSYTAAIEEIESQRRSLSDPGLQGWLVESRRGPYESLFGIQARRGQIWPAVTTMERLLAFRLADEVAGTGTSVERLPLQAVQRWLALRSILRTTGVLAGESDVSAPNHLGEESPAVAFFEAADDVWRVTVAGPRASIKRLPASRAVVCALASSFSANPDDRAVAAQLGDLLFPAQTLSDLGPRFAVVPPRCAPNVPVAALIVDGTTLVARHVLTLAPALALAHHRTRQVAATGPALLIGDPRSDLPAAREEIRRLAEEMEATPTVGPSATVASTSAEHAPRLLHLATHSAVGLAGPSLVLADGSLSVTDILGLHNPAQLVTLATCSSGARSAVGGQESLANAFLNAGSRNVLATLRSVEDHFADRIVVEFYRRGGLADPAGALAVVQRGLLASEPPSRWAAFFVAGSAEPLPNRTQVSSR